MVLFQFIKPRGRELQAAIRKSGALNTERHEVCPSGTSKGMPLRCASLGVPFGTEKGKREAMLADNEKPLTVPPGVKPGDPFKKEKSLW
jgi:hypothetical protein